LFKTLDSSGDLAKYADAEVILRTMEPLFILDDKIPEGDTSTAGRCSTSGNGLGLNSVV